MYRWFSNTILNIPFTFTEANVANWLEQIKTLIDRIHTIIRMHPLILVCEYPLVPLRRKGKGRKTTHTNKFFAPSVIYINPRYAVTEGFSKLSISWDEMILYRCLSGQLSRFSIFCIVHGFWSCSDHTGHAR